MVDAETHWFRLLIYRVESYLVVALPVVGTVMVTIGQALDDVGDWFWVIGGALLVLLGGLVQLMTTRRHKRLSSADLNQAARFRIAMKDALQPVVEAMAYMPYLPKKSRESTLVKVVERAVAALNLLLRNVDRVRVVVFKVDEDGNSLKPMSHFGRGQSPRGFIAGTTRGDRALSMVAKAGDQFVRDLDKEAPTEWEGSGSGYRTFISAAINAGDYSYGMVTVDAPVAGSLVDTDCQLVLLIADLLAVAFAEADRS